MKTPQLHVSLSSLIYISCTDSSYCPLTALLHSFHELTYPFLWTLQGVSAPCKLGFFQWPDKSLPLLSPESECPLLKLAQSHSFHVLTSPSLCHLQDVSAL